MKVKRILILFFLFIFTSTFCYASEITLDTTGELIKNSKLNINININLGELEENVYFLQGQLEYDTNIFKKVEATDFELLNGWHDLVFNPENGMFIVEGTETNETDLQNIMNIQMEVKTSSDSTTINLKNIKEIGDSQIEIELEDASIELKKPETDNFANTILPFTGGNLIIIYGILFAIIVLTVFFIYYKKKQNKSIH